MLGLAYACNFGGILTPISSLQNVLAVAQLQEVCKSIFKYFYPSVFRHLLCIVNDVAKAGIEITFFKWIWISFPFGLVCVLLTWMTLIVVVAPTDISSIPVVVYERDKPPLSKRSIVVISITLIVIVLFASFGAVKPFFGDIGIVAILFVTVMFGSGLLSEVSPVTD